ncbi:MAG: cobalamin B12-binding domain-containing protein, partial [Planctomycetes bacterium]|nr:cobalamin B12-binding domain-containing protein [Planctomycetota bacterium]
MTNFIRKAVRVLLINPHVWSSDCCSSMVSALGEEPYPPIGLLYLAAYMRSCGYEVRLLDIPVVLKQKRHEAEIKEVIRGISDLVLEEIVAGHIQDFRPDLVGISCLFSGKFRSTVFISEAVKKVAPTCLVVIGGLHPTIFAREAIERLPSVDFVILGEGEESFVDLLSSIFDNRIPLYDVDGLAFRDSEGIHNTTKTH